MTQCDRIPICRSGLLTLLLFLLFAPLQAPAEGQEAAEVTGSLVVQVVDDFESGRSSLVYAVQDETTGRLVGLDLPGRPVSGLKSGARVRVQGRLHRERILVGTLERLQPKAAAGITAAAMTGPRRVVAIMVNMADATFGANCYRGEVASKLFTAYESMAPLFQEASFGQLTFPADTNADGQVDVFGPFLIPDSTSDGQGQIPRYSWIHHAEEVAAAAGVNFSLYQHRVFVFPRGADTCLGLWGELGCSSGTCYIGVCGWPEYIPSCVDAHVFAHEIGHNLGMHHASLDADNDGVVDPFQEYGDRSDVMGNSNFFHPNAAHKFQMGWFDGYPGSVLGLDLNAPGRQTIFTLSAIEHVPSSVVHPQVLHLAGDYFLSTRAAVGYDTNIDQPPGFVGVTSVHRLTADGHTLRIATLGDGEKLELPAFRVRQLSHTADSVTVEIPTGAFQTFQVSSVSPSGGPTSGNTPLTVRGFEFQPGAQVEVGGVAATGENVIDSTTITAVTPAHAAGAVNVAVINPGAGTASRPNAFFYYAPATLAFHTLTPCRVIDTRDPVGPYGGPALIPGATRIFTIAGRCGVPAAARTISVNITVTGPTQPGHLELFPADAFPFGTSSINFSAGQTRANNAVLMLATDGTGRVSVANGSSGSTHLILDINGWFQ